MSSRFYGSLWVLYFATAGVLFLGGILDMTAMIVYGFLAFGLVFAGMICVLPNLASHPTAKPEPVKPRKRAQTAPAAPFRVSAGQTHFPVGLRTH